MKTFPLSLLNAWWSPTKAPARVELISLSFLNNSSKNFPDFDNFLRVLSILLLTSVEISETVLNFLRIKRSMKIFFSFWLCSTFCDWKYLSYLSLIIFSISAIFPSYKLLLFFISDSSSFSFFYLSSPFNFFNIY